MQIVASRARRFDISNGDTLVTTGSIVVHAILANSTSARVIIKFRDNDDNELAEMTVGSIFFPTTNIRPTVISNVAFLAPNGLKINANGNGTVSLLTSQEGA